MKQKIRIKNSFDENLNPAGGTASGIGIDISWQDGPLVKLSEGSEARYPPNGAFVEDVIEIAKKRLEFYQNSGFNCYENESAIKYLDFALRDLTARTKRREAEGVEGSHKGA